MLPAAKFTEIFVVVSSVVMVCSTTILVPHKDGNLQWYRLRTYHHIIHVGVMAEKSICILNGCWNRSSSVRAINHMQNSIFMCQQFRFLCDTSIGLSWCCKNNSIVL